MHTSFSSVFYSNNYVSWNNSIKVLTKPKSATHKAKLASLGLNLGMSNPEDQTRDNGVLVGNINWYYVDECEVPFLLISHRSLIVVSANLVTVVEPLQTTSSLAMLILSHTVIGIVNI